MNNCPTCQTANVDGASFCVGCGTRLPVARPGVATGMLQQRTILQDRYVIQEKIGQGGMGAVYRANDRRLGTVTWAIKEMSEAALDGEQHRQQAREAFRGEAEMLAALAHPNLPRVTDHFEQNGKAYLVMEFVPGETLLNLLQREGVPQPLPRVLDWARQLGDVLEYLHSQNPPIIFRDLKPANIMLTPHGQIKLIDFGIARLFKPGQERDTQAFGTMGYSAPEQYGRGQTDARSDVYSLGVLLHQLLTGFDPTSAPFRLPSAAQLNPAIAPELNAVLSRATSTEPNQRFGGVRDFCTALIQAADSNSPQTAGFPQGGQVYGRPATHPYGPPTPPAYASGSYPTPTVPSGYAMPDAMMYGDGGSAAARTTSLANTSRILGIISVLVMGVACAMIIAGEASGENSDLSGFGALLGVLPLAGGPIAVVMGVVALTQNQISDTLLGRRHAVIGISTGFVTLLMCCAVLLVIGSASS